MQLSSWLLLRKRPKHHGRWWAIRISPRRPRTLGIVGLRECHWYLDSISTQSNHKIIRKLMYSVRRRKG
ncbi:hypothetical protein AG1IA_03322 [Rhizoctonia solani AG-1 IA]|uniref:Uncharacterized protein n=1 Tax=Thanatephorus cucumeris (strain AG1-IA) TaxID=983506 RepID=L8X0T7_THACA|nr:hypothetical protein AG1IA_03322 [Rhizoctonia solani AG-1 IA]